MTFGRCAHLGFPRGWIDEPNREFPMRRLFLRAGLCLFLLLPAAAQAEEGERPHSGVLQASCNIDSDFDLQVDADGLRLEADDDAEAGLPGQIEISDGTLHLDGVPRAVSDEDAERLRGIEAGVRGMLPGMTAIAREAIAITFDALGGVNAALGGKRSEARRFRDMREGALARVDGMEARGEWSSALFGEEFEAEVEAAAESMAASFTPTRAIWMAVSGGFGRMERRMEKWEAEFEEQMAVREAALERQATALCGQLEEVQRLQDAMELRLGDGRPLRVIEVSRGEVAAR